MTSTYKTIRLALGYSFFLRWWKRHLVTSPAECLKEFDEYCLEMSVFVQLIDLNHHGHVEADKALSSNEVVIDQPTLNKNALELINHHEGLVSWLQVMASEFLVQLVKYREVRFENVINLFVPIALISPFLRVQMSVEGQQILLI